LGIDVVLIQPGTYPTNMFASAQQPGDAGRTADYGPLAAIPEKIVQTILDGFKGENAPDPHDVAVTIADLVKQPNGSRPDRVGRRPAFWCGCHKRHGSRRADPTTRGPRPVVPRKAVCGPPRALNPYCGPVDMPARFDLAVTREQRPRLGLGDPRNNNKSLPAESPVTVPCERINFAIDSAPRSEVDLLRNR
jgi:hypothetical protein